MKRLFILSFFLFPLFCIAQKQGNIWVFAGNNIIDFNSGSPVLGYNSVIPFNAYTEGTACISDSSGNLLFFSDGEKIWNKNQQVMPNGDSILGGRSACQAAFIVPLPGSNNLFYVFSVGDVNNPPGTNSLNRGFRYSIVDMCLDNGFGDVLPGKKNILLLDTVTEKQAGTFHSNGTDIWLVVHKYFSDAFYVYKITSSGITDTVISQIGSYHPFDSTNNLYGMIGHMRISPDGSKLALVTRDMNSALIQLFDFNNATGIISNPITLPQFGTYWPSDDYGLAFSPDNTKLYACNIDDGEIMQWDLSSGNSSDIIASANIICDINKLFPYDMQLGPDGKIYISTYCNQSNKTLSIITQPNNLGAACGFVQDGFWLNDYAGRSLPGFIDSYKYKNGIVNCTPPSINATAIIQDIPCPDECTGTALALTTEGVPPHTYSWSTIPVQTAQTATGLCAGIYSVTITDSTGVSGTASVTIVNYPQPVPVIDSTNFTLECTQIFVSYQWHFNGNAINGATNQSYTPAQNGLYTVEVTDNNGCTGISAGYNVVWVGIEEIRNGNAIYVYPNPANSILSIELGVASVSAHLSVYNILGKEIISKTFTGNKTQIDVSGLAKGLYLLKVQEDEVGKLHPAAVVVKRFVKE